MTNRGPAPVSQTRRAANSAARALVHRCALAALLFLSSSAAYAADDAEAIKGLIGSTFDRPDATVETEPVVVSGDHAIASWTQSGHGGRALLKQTDGHWKIVLCSGDSLKSEEALRSIGIPDAAAKELAAALDAAELQVSAERRALFSTFEGTVHMDTSHHPH